VKCVGADDIVAPNTRQQLGEAAEVMQSRLQAALMAEGVGITDPRTTWVEAGVVAGQDTQILPFTFVGRGSRLGERCTIGPFAHLPAGTVLKAGEALANNAGAPMGVSPAGGGLT